MYSFRSMILKRTTVIHNIRQKNWVTAGDEGERDLFEIIFLGIYVNLGSFLAPLMKGTFWTKYSMVTVCSQAVGIRREIWLEESGL